MQEPYPYVRFVVGIAQPLCVAVAAVLFLGGTVRACETGGFAGFVGFLIAILGAGFGYVSTMVSVESLRMLLDIEQHGRRMLEERGPSGGSGPS